MGLMMNWTQKDIENIKSRLLNGESVKHLAESLKVSVGEVHRLCFLHGINIQKIYTTTKRVQKSSPEQLKRQEKKEKERSEKSKKREQEKNEYRRGVAARRQERADRASQIAELRRGGATYLEIGEKYGLTVERVRQILHSYNKTADNPVLPEEFNHKRPPSPEVKVRREKVAKLRRTGLSHQQIAQKMNVSIGVIRQDLEVYNRESDNPIVPFRVDKRQHIDEQAKLDIVKMRKRGVSISDIAKKYDVGNSRIYQILEMAEWNESNRFQ
jgi:uncharacterized protein (DUF433 family)